MTMLGLQRRKHCKARLAQCRAKLDIESRKLVRHCLKWNSRGPTQWSTFRRVIRILLLAINWCLGGSKSRAKISGFAGTRVSFYCQLYVGAPQFVIANGVRNIMFVSIISPAVAIQLGILVRADINFIIWTAIARYVAIDLHCDSTVHADLKQGAIPDVLW